MCDETRMRDQTGPRAARSDDDLPDANGIGRKGDRRQRTTLYVEQRQVGSGIAPDDACGDLSVGRARAHLIISVEQVIRHDEGLRIDDSAAGGASTTPAEEDQARRDSCRGRGKVVRELLCE